MALDLHKGARQDERFHLQLGMPVPTVTHVWGFYKRVTWENLTLPNGMTGTWVSHWLIGNALYWYRGTCKCDGTRTRMYWGGQLDDGTGMPYVPDPHQYIMTTTPSEMLSVRFFMKSSAPAWDAMGGS